MFTELATLADKTKKIKVPKPEDEGDLIIECPLEDPEIESEADKLDILYDVVENYLKNGHLTEADRTTIRDNDLLQGTSLMVLSMESFGGALGPVISQESLLAATTQKAKEYAAKTVAFFSNTYRKIKDAVSPVLAETGDLLAKAYTTAKDTVVSHPIVAITSATAAVAAITAGVAIATGALKTGDVKKVYDAFRNIKWPGWKVPTKGKGPAPSGVKVDPAPAGTLLLEGPAHGGGAKGATIGALKSTYEQFVDAVKKLWGVISEYQTALSGFANRGWETIKPVVGPVGEGIAWLIGYPYSKLKSIQLVANSFYARGDIQKGMGVQKLASYIQKYLDFIILGSLTLLANKIVKTVISLVKKCIPSRKPTEGTQEPEGAAQSA